MNNNNKHILIGVVLCLVAYLASRYLWLQPDTISFTLAITVITAYFWVTEALPIPLTSVIPIGLFPFVGVLTHQQAASSLGSHVIVLLMGAFMLAVGIEKSGVHRRIAFAILKVIGGDSALRIIFAIMATSSILSMWISNTATVVALLPVVLAICASTDDNRFKIALLLGLAYSASLGGVGTLIGTPPNVIFASVYEEFAGEEYGFIRWMKVTVPIIVISIPLMALWLARGIRLSSAIHLPKCDGWSIAEKRVLVIFALVALLWVFRKEPLGGWSQMLDINTVGDSSVALLGVLAMAITSNGKGGRILEWQDAKEIPWGMLLLFAGGICIAKAFVSSGLSELLGQFFVALGTLPVLLSLFALAIGVSFLTEITSNTATATLMMPIIASAAIALNLPIELLMIPVVISCSCAFCLPVATAPNSIVFASGEVSIKDMAKQGVALNVLVASIVALVSFYFLT
ncbi:SLC13 family permease [Pseudoalteromonas spongiae]|uniref:SLC13 family permease n=1 Tax=Pseudoalteromonas spongiae TaxID=298657 RepID=UPI00026CCDAE|nr:SLC13 family permease [Pseudoalteromonas spongiae]ATC98797.1 solute carrier family 13 (sodium-dependent dicarboxylate transporter), member 2/3/5 [Pseudoalteromonas spongiae UST010723-006]